METYSFKPQPDDAERIRARVDATRVWWVELSEPVERLFCDKAHLAVASLVDAGISIAGLESHYYPARRPTDRPDVWLLEYGIPMERVAVEHQHMRGWMALLRANGCHGRYREAGTDRWYEF